MIPFIDLKKQYAKIENNIHQRINSVLEHGKYIMGPEVQELEKKLSDYVGVKHCIGCGSGTEALLMSLMAANIGPGDAVFTTPFTFIATAEVISLLGATPVFVDIDPGTFNVDVDHLKLVIEALVKRDVSLYPLPKQAVESELTPKAIITVDLFGLPCDYDRINLIAKENNLLVIEDSAQGLGGVYKGKSSCSLTEIGCTSFFPAKPLGAYGDAGAIFTDCDDIAQKIKSIRVHGKGSDKYDNIRIGLNGRIDTIQAAILLSKFEIFPWEIEERQRVACKYSDVLEKFIDITPPIVPDGYKSAWAQYAILSPRRSEMQDLLKQNGIPTAIYYPKPLHLQTAFQYLGYKEGDMPVCEKIVDLIFCLPMHPYLSDIEIENITKFLTSEL